MRKYILIEKGVEREREREREKYEIKI